MTKKKEQTPDADGRTEVTLDKGLRTHDDKVFFSGTVSVDQRTARSISTAQQAGDEVRKRRELAVEEEEGDNPLGDTRTSTATKRAMRAEGGHGARFENIRK